jgi:hypothetical protein
MIPGQPAPVHSLTAALGNRCGISALRRGGGTATSDPGRVTCPVCVQALLNRGAVTGPAGGRTVAG